MDDICVVVSYVQLFFEYMVVLGCVDMLGVLLVFGESFVVMWCWQVLLEQVCMVDFGFQVIFVLWLVCGIVLWYFGVVGFVVLVCGMLVEVLQCLECYYCLVYDVNVVYVYFCVEGLCIEWGVECGCFGVLVDEIVIVVFVQFMCEFIGWFVCVLVVDFVNCCFVDL